MDWAKFGATVGVEVFKTVYDSKKDAELNEAIRQRDVYKMEADCLKSHLQDVKKYTGGTTSKHNAHSNTRNFNQVSSQTARNHTKSGGQNQYVRKKLNQDRRDPQNNTSQTHQKSSQPWSNSGSNTGKTNSNGDWGSSGKNNGKANFSAPSGRGSSHSRGGGRGRGRGRGSARH